MPQSTQYKLTYFNVYGRAEPIRLIFAQSGVEYEDERLEHGDEWEKRKPTTPYGQLPILEVDGKVLPQSRAISTYLAKQFGLDGQNDWESAEVQAVICGLDDVKLHLRPSQREKDVDKKAELLQKFEHDFLVPFLDRMEKHLKNNGSGYFVGSQLTQADLHMFNALERWNEIKLSDALKNYPELAMFVDKIGHLPKIKEWIDRRPKTCK